MGSISIVFASVSLRDGAYKYPILDPFGWPLYDPAPSTRAARKYLLLRKGSAGS